MSEDPSVPARILIAGALLLAGGAARASHFHWKYTVTDSPDPKFNVKMASIGDRAEPVETGNGWSCTILAPQLQPGKDLTAEARAIRCEKGDVFVMSDAQCLQGAGLQQNDDGSLTLGVKAGIGTTIRIFCAK